MKEKLVGLLMVSMITGIPEALAVGLLYKIFGL